MYGVALARMHRFHDAHRRPNHASRLARPLRSLARTSCVLGLASIFIAHEGLPARGDAHCFRGSRLPFQSKIESEPIWSWLTSGKDERYSKVSELWKQFIPLEDRERATWACLDPAPGDPRSRLNPSVRTPGHLRKASDLFEAGLSRNSSAWGQLVPTTHGRASSARVPPQRAHTIPHIPWWS